MKQSYHLQLHSKRSKLKPPLTQIATNATSIVVSSPCILYYRLHLPSARARESLQSPRRPGTVMDSLAQTSSGWAEARATYKRRCGAARCRRRPRERRKVVATSAEEGPTVVAAAEVPRRRTAMPKSPEQVGAGEDAEGSTRRAVVARERRGEREAYLMPGRNRSPLSGAKAKRPGPPIQTLRVAGSPPCFWADRQPCIAKSLFLKKVKAP